MSEQMNPFPKNSRLRALQAQAQLEDLDFYTLVASDLFTVPYSKVDRGMRERTKCYVFGWVYGFRGVFKASKNTPLRRAVRRGEMRARRAKR